MRDMSHEITMADWWRMLGDLPGIAQVAADTHQDPAAWRGVLADDLRQVADQIANV